MASMKTCYPESGRIILEMDAAKGPNVEFDNLPRAFGEEDLKGFLNYLAVE